MLMALWIHQESKCAINKMNYSILKWCSHWMLTQKIVCDSAFSSVEPIYSDCISNVHVCSFGQQYCATCG